MSTFSEDFFAKPPPVLTEAMRLALEARRKDMERYHYVLGLLLLSGGGVVALYVLFWLAFAVHLAIKYW